MPRSFPAENDNRFQVQGKTTIFHVFFCLTVKYLQMNSSQDMSICHVGVFNTGLMKVNRNIWFGRASFSRALRLKQIQIVP